jgi:signal transduction histidine kinase
VSGNLASRREKPFDTIVERARAMATTIRGKILLAFCILAAITIFLGHYAVTSVVESGRLVVATYDKPLMAISYARLAHTQFTQMELAHTQRQSVVDRNRWRLLDDRFKKLAHLLSQSLEVAENRSISAGATAAVKTTRRAIDQWNEVRQRIIAGSNSPEDRAALEKHAATVGSALDQLVELTAQDGFTHREMSLSSIETYRMASIATTIVALVLGIIVAVLLARQMVRPIAIASYAASRIAVGELDIEIGSAGSDELGQLLESMTVMRDNIRGMMEHEIAARRSAQARLNNAIESSSEGFILIDEEGQILLTNSQIASFFPELVNDLDVGAGLPVAIESALAQPTAEMGLSDGRWLRLGRSDTADGGFIIICSDISAMKERETVLHAAKEQAEQASRSKSEFLANMSHELRTPLNAIIGFSEIFMREIMGPLPTRYQDYGADIFNAGHHLLSMINDLLDLSKIEVGQLELFEETIEISKVFNSCLPIIGERARQKNITVATEIAPNLPLLHVDERRLKQIMLNLLSNAVKFTPDFGHVVAAARISTTGGIAISLSDTGIGMRPEDVPIAFEPFRQIDGALNRRYEGTGLGLPLVQQIAALHGGSIDIQTTLGGGTTVTVLLPEYRCVRAVA